MKFYSGFSIKNEEHFFNELIDKSDYCISGFSYGSMKAFNKVKSELANGNRVDRLQLFSPLFFQTKEKSFKRLQLIAYRKNESVYLQQFINKCFFPYDKKDIQREITVIDELDELLYYKWKIQDLKEIVEQGVKIEIYLGEKDSIIDAKSAKEFFLEVATVTYIKNANHFLQID